MSCSYQIRVRGRITERTRRALTEYSVRVDDVDTALTGSFQDDAQYKGFLALLDDLGLELIELRRLADEPPA